MLISHQLGVNVSHFVFGCQQHLLLQTPGSSCHREDVHQRAVIRVCDVAGFVNRSDSLDRNLKEL